MASAASILLLGITRSRSDSFDYINCLVPALQGHLDQVVLTDVIEVYSALLQPLLKLQELSRVASCGVFGTLLCVLRRVRLLDVVLALPVDDRSVL